MQSLCRMAVPYRRIGRLFHAVPFVLISMAWAPAPVPAQSQIFPPSIDLADLNGNDGFVMYGARLGDDTGWIVSGMGDVDGDGVDDIAIGAPRADSIVGGNSGRVYVVSGRTQPNGPRSFDLENLNGVSGFKILGLEAFDSLGISVAGLGDVNADGLEDFIIGARGHDAVGRTDAGAVYVVFGAAGLGSSGEFDLTTIDGTNGFMIEGSEARAGIGYSVGHAGDLNNDGIADLVIGAPESDVPGRVDCGAAYVVFGSPVLGSGGAFDLTQLDGSNGFKILGAAAGEFGGFRVAGAGDMNGDQIDDLAISSPGFSGSSGRVHVLLGSEEIGGSGLIDLAGLAWPGGFAILASASGEGAGRALDGNGDVNGDGFGDLLIGAPLADPSNRSNAGSAFVLFGSETIGAAGPILLSSLNGDDGFRVDGTNASDALGSAVTLVSIDDTPYTDVAIGAPGADPHGPASGSIFVLRGAAGLGQPNGRLSVDTLNGVDGFALHGVGASDQTGAALAGGLDLNGDDLEDLIVGAPTARNGDSVRAGNAFAFLGRRDPQTLVLSAEAFVLGERTRLTCTGAEPGERIQFASSQAGPGPTFINALGIDLDLSDPILLLGRGRADATGTVSIRQLVTPTNFAVGPIWVQAYIYRTGGSVKSNMIESEVTE